MTDRTARGACMIAWLWLTGLALLAFVGRPVRRHHVEAAGLAFGAALVLLAIVRRGRPVPGRLESAHAGRWVHLVPAALAAAAFGWSVTLGPLSDDFVLARWARAGDWTPDEWTYVRPLPLAIWGAVFGLGGGWPALHGLTLLLHALNSALVARIGAVWGGARAGLVAGALFALFPASAEAVTWTAGIFDLLAASFVLLGVAQWSAAASAARTTLVVAFAAAAGLLSKESALALPGLLLAALVILPWAPARVARTSAAIAALAVCAASVLLRIALQPGSLSHLAEWMPSSQYELKEFLVRPFAAASMPFRSDLELPPGAYVGGLALLVVLGMVARRVMREDEGRSDAARLTLFGSSWVLLAAAPLLLQFYVSPALEGSRYAYLPVAGFCLLLSAPFVAGGGRMTQVTAATAAAALVAVYAARLSEERRLRVEAASIRDALLASAADVAHAAGCRSIEIRDAPDSRRGVYIFREGLADALARVPRDPSGEPCVLQWTGTALERH